MRGQNSFEWLTHIRGAFAATLIFILFIFSSTAGADTLRLPYAKGKILNAEYLRGDIQRPAIVVLHGFLQTNEFLATQSIVSSLSALGYTVIAPNFSLGVPDRRQSMQCQAPHRHTFEEDLNEIDFWLSWLRQQGYSKIIIVGHSWGSQHGLGYVETHPQAPVVAVIAVSLVHMEQAMAVRAKQIKQAQIRAERRDKSLQAYKLSFCKAFMATPQSYLSYARWDDVRVIDALSGLQRRKLPVYVVLGGEDNRIDDNWVRSLRAHARQITVIAGANHFFSSMHEFELSDRLEAILAEIDAAIK